MSRTTTTPVALPTITVASVCDCSDELAIDEATELTVAEFDALFDALGEDCTPAGGYAKVRWSTTMADGTGIGTRLDPCHGSHDLAIELDHGANHYSWLADNGGGHGNTREACEAFAAGYADLAAAVRASRVEAPTADAIYVDQLEAFLGL